MASSTTKPTARVSAIRDRLFMLKSSRYMIANVPAIDIGNARLGIIVAETFRKKRKITSTTRKTVPIKVSWTSWTDSRIDCVRSKNTSSSIDCGICARRVGSTALMASTTSTTFAPGCR